MGDTTFARLAVDPDDRLVAAADVLGVDRQVRYLPGQVRGGPPGRRGLIVQVGQALGDGVLMGAGKGGEYQVARVRMPGVHRHLVALLDDPADGGDVGDVELRVDSPAEQVEGQGDQADVAGPLTVAEERPLDAVSSRRERELSRGDGGAAVVVRGDRQDNRVAGVG